MARPSAGERFDQYVDRADGCHEWRGAINPTGYGQFWAAGKSISAHRFAFIRSNGPIPADRVIDHLCRNRRCVNPAHMELVTTKENVLRGESRWAINARRTTCAQGHPFVAGNFRRAFSKGKPVRSCLACHRERETVRRELRRKAG